MGGVSIDHGKGSSAGACVLAPYGRELLGASCWLWLLVAVGLLEMLSRSFLIGSFAVGWFRWTWVGIAVFAVGAIFEAVVIRLTGSGTQPSELTDLPKAPPGSVVENPARTALRVVVYSWPILLGLVAGLALPPAGGFSGGAALASALSCAWEFRNVSGAEKRRGWRLLWAPPPRPRLTRIGAPQTRYYRGDSRVRILARTSEPRS